MTGTQLLEALSFVDETYIQEAETAQLGRNTPWIKILSAAACLCILITGVYAFGLTQHKGTMEAAAPAAPAEAPAEAAPREEAVAEEAAPEPPRAVEEEIPSGELQQIPYACLQVVKVLEEGVFEAIVEADEPMKMETLVKVVVDPSKVPQANAEIQNDLSRIRENITVAVENGAYDAGTNTLFVAEVFFLREGE